MSTASLLPANWDLPHELREQVGAFASRQRELQAQGHLLLVLHQLPKRADPERKSLLLWRSPEGEWKGLRETYLEGELEVVDAQPAVLRLLQEYDARIDELEALFAKANSAQQLFHVLRETIPVMRAMKNMLAALTSAREKLPKVRDLLVWREEAHGTGRAVELLYEEARAALDFSIAEEAEVQSQANLEMARAAHRLNSMAALFLPITAMGAAFGMNLASGLEGYGNWLFWILLISGIATGFLFRTFIEKRSSPLQRLLQMRKVRLPFHISPPPPPEDTQP